MTEPKPSQGRKVMFKRHAHPFTLISTVWTVFSALAILFVSGRSDRDDKGFLVAVGILIVHAVCIPLSIYFWNTEKESVL
jgi:hypothetical protein